MGCLQSNKKESYIVHIKETGQGPEICSSGRRDQNGGDSKVRIIETLLKTEASFII